MPAQQHASSADEPPATRSDSQLGDDPSLISLAARNELRVRHFGQWLTLLGGSALVVGGALVVLVNQRLMSVAVEHFSAVVGLPSAALASLYVVSFLEKTSGHIEFEGLGFRFKGASGPIVLWIFCFLAVVGAIKLLW